MTQPMRPQISSTLTRLAGSSPVNMPNATVNAAPIPTHAAYAVPMGSAHRVAEAGHAGGKGCEEHHAGRQPGEALTPAERDSPHGFEYSCDD